MALKVERQGVVTTQVGVYNKPLCHTCRLRKDGPYTLDVYHNPQCADCAALDGKPIPARKADDA